MDDHRRPINRASLTGIALLAACVGASGRGAVGLPPVQVTSDAATGELAGPSAHGPSVVVGDDGQPWVAWTEGSGSDSRSVVARRSVAGWRLVDARKGCTAPHLALSALGTLVAIRTCGDGPERDVFVAAYREDRWTEMPGLDRAALTTVRWEVGLESAVAVDGQGGIVVAAAGSSGLAVFRHDGTRWERLPTIAHSSTRVHGPAVAVDGGGAPLVAWSEQRDAAVRDAEVYAARFAGGAWSPLGGGEGRVSRHAPTEEQKHSESAAVFCTMVPGNFDFTNPALAPGPGARITLAFEGDTVERTGSCPTGQVFAGAYAGPDAAWDGPADAAQDVGLGAAGTIAETPTATSLPPDDVLLAWVEASVDGADAPRWIRVRRGAPGRWSPMPELPDVFDAYEPALAANATTACLAYRTPRGIGVRCAPLLTRGAQGDVPF
jgi:hypothetical protein